MDVNGERFKYLVANQSIWAKMYQKQKEIQREEHRIKHSKYILITNQLDSKLTNRNHIMF